MPLKNFIPQIHAAAPAAMPTPSAAPWGIPITLCRMVIVVVAIANATISISTNKMAAACFIVLIAPSVFGSVEV